MQSEVKPGFERITLSCGAYHDRPIKRAGEKRCSGCERCLVEDELCAIGANQSVSRACRDCLDDGRIVRCDSCGCLTFSEWIQAFSDRKSATISERETSCKTCCRIFEFAIQGSDRVVRLDVSSSVKTDYFYSAIAEELKIDDIRVHISKMPRGMMMCTAEYRKKKYRSFDVTIS